MRQFLNINVVVLAGLSAALGFAGCELAGPSDYGAVLTPPAEEPVDEAAASAQAFAKRLATAQRPTAQSMAPATGEVIWLGSSQPTEATLPPDQTIEAPLEPEAVAPAVAETSGGRSQIVNAMLGRVRVEDKSDFAKALAAVAVSLTDAHHDLDYQFLSPLPPRQQNTVEKYHILLTVLHEQLLSHPNGIDRGAFDAQLNELFGQQPIAIRNMLLCRRVMGYGVYEPFDSTTFMAGRDHKMIVYVELDHFRAVQRTNEQYSVDLQQEVTLYSSDGLAVWRNEPVKIHDVSRNRRRDFFVVQLIKLPSRLSVGKYRLKIRVTDLNGSSIDEQGLDVNYVADHALVQDTPNPRDSLPLQRR